MKARFVAHRRNDAFDLFQRNELPDEQSPKWLARCEHAAARQFLWQVNTVRDNDQTIFEVRHSMKSPIKLRLAKADPGTHPAQYDLLPDYLTPPRRLLR